MSIFGSLSAPDDSDHEDDCAVWVKNGDIWYFGSAPCSCGKLVEF